MGIAILTGVLIIQNMVIIFLLKKIIRGQGFKIHKKDIIELGEQIGHYSNKYRNG